MSTCLSDEQLERLAAMAPEEAGTRPLYRHVEQCRPCAHRLAECRANHALASELAAVLHGPEDDHRQTATHDSAGRNNGPTPVTARQERSEGLPLTRSEDDLDKLRSFAARGDLELPADSIPGYEIIREIHRGGQGVVYEAIQQSTRRTVAVKVLLEGRFASERSRWRFEREVKLVANLKHPDIVVIHDSGIAEGRYYFAMDYVRGQPLDTHARLAGLTVRQVVSLFAQVCDAVSYAHRHGIIHRDLKPSNILVGEDGQPQVLDFGLAKIVGEETAESHQGLATMAGQILGTIRYMSPEQTRGKPEEIDVRTDIYSLGVILYELLARTAPYPTNTDLSTALRNIQLVDPPRPSRLRADLSSELDAIVLKALQKEPGRRYQSAGELQQDLQAWLDGRAVTAKSDSALYVLRKLAARHYFQTSVIVALVATIIGSTGVLFHFLQQTRSALRDKTASEASTQAAWKDMQRFFDEAQILLRRRSLGSFLLEWRENRLDQARRIRSEVGGNTPEYQAMSFLLDERMTVEQLVPRLPARSDAMMHFLAGERCLKSGQADDARREFDLSVQDTAAEYEWFRGLAETRLKQLHPPAAAGDQQTQGQESPK